MVIAVSVAILVMMFASGPLTSFVSSHPTVVILALGFLLMIGFSLFAEGWGFTISKSYLYAAIAFSVMIEMLNQIATRNRVKQAVAGNFRARTADVFCIFSVAHRVQVRSRRTCPWFGQQGPPATCSRPPSAEWWEESWAWPSGRCGQL
jgi:hypothetical protein